MDSATQRRLYEELGLRCPLEFLFKFEYQAQFDATGAEHELCSVFIGRTDDPVRVNAQEIVASRWIGPEELQSELRAHGAARFTPWFIIEWARISAEHREALGRLQTQIESFRTRAAVRYRMATALHLFHCAAKSIADR